MSKIVPRPSLAPSPHPTSAGLPQSPETVASPNPSPQPLIMTLKEWVLPPRPKPGRKPSADTPASKRKAQNRAAQRAFRERRATRVQELEGKLMEVEKERELKESTLVQTISKLKSENQFLAKNLEQLRNEMQVLIWNQKNGQVPPPAGQAPKTNSPRPSIAPPVAASARQTLSSTLFAKYASPAARSPLTAALPGSSTSSNYLVQQISPAPSGDSPPLFVAGATTPAVTDDTCGVCVKEECFCEEVGLKEPRDSRLKQGSSSGRTLNDLIQAVQPLAAVSLKRTSKPKSSMETDFTAQFGGKKRMPDLTSLVNKSKRPRSSGSNDNSKTSSISSNNNNSFMENQLATSAGFDESSPVENCGFCSDDTPCVCREAAKEAMQLSNRLLGETIKEEPELEDAQIEDTSLPPIINRGMRNGLLPVLHPGPTVEIREFSNLSPGAVPTVIGPDEKTIQKSQLLITEPEALSPNKTEGCTGNPGTCSQCQMDPMSTLFCTTVASKTRVEDRSEIPVSSPAPLTPGASVQGLAVLEVVPGSRKNSVGANGMFIPCADAYKTLSRHKKFNSVDFGTLVGKLTTRGMQVEVQSVANVLRELDRNLYK